MRPPEFTGGNHGLLLRLIFFQVASMRPPEFTGRNRCGDRILVAEHIASMRPPEFTGGNDRYVLCDDRGVPMLQ